MSILTPDVEGGPLSVDAVWATWSRDRNQAARDELVNRHGDLVRIIAAKTFRHRYSGELEFGDYVQFGMIGLLESIDRYDPAFGNKFETFASHRILGAILNGVETLSEKQQQIASRIRVRAERARHLADGSQIREARAATDALHRLADVAVGLAIGYMLDGAGMYLEGEPSTGNTPYEQVEIAELRQRMAMLVDHLPVQERRVIRSHYFQNLQFEEIARTMQLSKGRISQIHHAALQRLRELHLTSGRWTPTAF
jgi:RNA polymerase sigma factor for flagellar operon FliA